MEETKKDAPNKSFEAFIEEVRAEALRHSDRAEWFRLFGETRMAEKERRLHRFYL